LLPVIEASSVQERSDINLNQNGVANSPRDLTVIADIVSTTATTSSSSSDQDSLDDAYKMSIAGSNIDVMISFDEADREKAKYFAGKAK
jgi:hypothetical protein